MTLFLGNLVSNSQHSAKCQILSQDLYICLHVRKQLFWKLSIYNVIFDYTFTPHTYLEVEADKYLTVSIVKIRDISQESILDCFSYRVSQKNVIIDFVSKGAFL